jgi:hypothetical protein
MLLELSIMLLELLMFIFGTDIVIAVLKSVLLENGWVAHLSKKSRLFKVNNVAKVSTSKSKY